MPRRERLHALRGFFDRAASRWAVLKLATGNRLPDAIFWISLFR